MSADVSASVRARLLNRAKARGEEFERTLSRFAVERLLYRIGAVARDRWTPKGASLLAVWLQDPYRSTRDIDVLAPGMTDERSIRELLATICSAPCPDDAIHFDLTDLVIQAIRADNDRAGRRVRFRAFLGQARIAMQMDVGVDDVMATAPELITYPTMLSTLPAPSVQAYPREQAIAEKLEAMISLGTRNSRMKDFHDVWALAGAFPFDGMALCHAISGCLTKRNTKWAGEIPPELTPDFYQMSELATRWRHYLAAGGVITPPPSQFGVIGDRVIQFLGPVCRSLAIGEPLLMQWPAGGPWMPPVNVTT